MFSLIPAFNSSNIPYIPYISSYTQYIVPINTQENLYLSRNVPSGQSQIMFIPKISTQTLKFDNLHQEINYPLTQFQYCDKIIFSEKNKENEPENNYIQRIQTPQPTNKIQFKQNHEINFFSELHSSENNANPQKKKLINKKKSQTKNLIKNSGRAILTFIIKNSELRQKVLKHLGIKESQFLESVYSFRSHIHTISAIRYLWQNHPFCKAFRILSCEYLRKHNLQHVFNSRVFKHSIYLKYQQKLMKSLQRPQEFQCIKQQ